jgi:AIR synthase-related protein
VTAELQALASELRDAAGVQHKRDIQRAAASVGAVVRGPWGAGGVRLGDDCAAIPDGDGHLLFAAEGMWPELVATEPRFAGYCSVLVNASDVYAMGGRPIAVVDALFAKDDASAEPLWQGIADASARLELPVVGGHTNLHSPYAGLAVAVLGRARRLLTSFDARPGDDLVVAYDLRGRMHPVHPFWDASTSAPAGRARADFEVLPAIAEAGWAQAAKDVSMGGVVGSTIMLLEASGVGATLWPDAVPRPGGVPLARWLLAFPSFGFVLAVPPLHTPQVLGAFAARELSAAVIGRVDDTRRLTLARTGEQAVVWDLARAPLTGFGAP